MVLTGQELLEYACGQFEGGAYETALRAFVLAYARNYEREWILENIYNCYMAGNEMEFRNSYGRWDFGEKTAYEKCMLDFIPYCEGEYYIYDREIQEFRGVFSVKTVESVVRQECFKQSEFSAMAAITDWNWSKMPEILSEAEYRKVYLVCKDKNRCDSFFKIPELEKFAKNIMIFSCKEEFQQYFHENTAEYLPKQCAGEEEERQGLLEIINQEHAYRLTPEGRNTERVLLTIGIPTYERGNLLLKRLENLRQMPYDAEIEFAISKNGTALYQEEYKSVSSIPDARINYKGYDETLTAWYNCKSVMQIAAGKFVLIVSDEDDVIISALEHYLKVLSSYTDLAMVRAKTCVQYSTIDRTMYYKKGKEALLGGFLGQNYMSGAIYHREKFWKSGVDVWDEKYYEDNSFYGFYPHAWCQVLLSDMGDYLEDNVCLISEGDSAYEDMKEQYSQTGNSLAENLKWDRNIPVYATWESRIEQHKDALECIHDFAGGDKELELKMLQRMLEKTVYLMINVKDKYELNEKKELTNTFVDETLLRLDAFGMGLSEKSKDGIISQLLS